MSTNYVVVDGSNIATEGRSLPSLKQLDEAVRAFLTEHPADNLTVVVDATFGHRIDASERDAYEEAVLAGELVSPPAGAIGRGDAFVLQIADKADAVILSNDSFQEFHGQYSWLFDEGRLIGGKPVPGLGWVFLLRSPVRGPASRRSVKEANSGRGSTRSTARSSGATKRGPSDRGGSGTSGRADKASKATKAAKTSGNSGRARREPSAPSTQLNELMPFIDFVGAHPVGSEVDATIDSFSSHGAYARVGEVQCYIPLKSMGDPAPLRARDVVNIGEVRTFTVASIDAPRRGIDLSLDPSRPPVDVSYALPQGVPIGTVAHQVDRTSEARIDAKDTTDVSVTATHSRAYHLAEEAPVTPVKKAAAKKAPAKKAPARKATAKKAVARKAPARKTAARKAPARKTAAKKAPARKTAAKKAPARKAVAKKAPARKTAAKKAPARKAVAKKAPARKTAAKKAPARKTAARKAPARKTAARKR
jgi:hypothetical protein